MDDLAFYGEPPLCELPEQEVCVSVTFSWDMARAFWLYDTWRARFRDVKIGGPAFAHHEPEFVAGRFLKPGITITSRGCPNNCPWCTVPTREGSLKELLTIEPGHIVQDNNLLACSRIHVERVFDMLMQQPRGAVFAGGLDARLLARWHIDWFKARAFRLAEAWFACDSPASVGTLDRVADLMADFPLRKKRCYVLAGFEPEDTPLAAEKRCDAVLAKGFCPFMMLYQPSSRRTYPPEWKAVQRKWTRPAAYLSKAPAASERNAP